MTIQGSDDRRDSETTQAPQNEVARALNRVADALFRQAKASERAVALQETMVQVQIQQAQTAAALEAALLAQQSRPRND